MNRRNFTKAAVSLPSLLLSACGSSLKIIEWEEEVPLNTGEIIWVKRADTYTRRSEPGNPLQMGWWPYAHRTYKFSWQGQQYTYELEGKGLRAPILLYVYAEQKTIVVIDSAWPVCAGYGEYKWAGSSWQLQPSINPEIVGQKRNLMEHSSAEDGAIPARVTQEWIRLQRFDLPQKGSTESHLSASKIAINCTGNK
jgi:hypothetical protein